MTEALWRVPVRVDDIPEAGRRFELTADAATRERVAQVAGLLGLDQLSAEFEVTRQGRRGLHVAGTVNASVQQKCVVTLDPVANEVAEDVDLSFAPAADGHEATADGEGEGPEEIVGDTIDLGGLAIEFMTLGLDPYPRKPDAIFEAPTPAEPASGPFAALASLKKSGEEKP